MAKWAEAAAIESGVDVKLLRFHGTAPQEAVSDEVGMRKPNADIFHYALDLLHVHPSEAVYVGDHLIQQNDHIIGWLTLEKEYPY